MFSQLQTLESLPNIKLATDRFKTFWASNTLLYLLLACFREILNLGWDFDYVMNISESDFLVKPLEAFEAHLRTRVGKNFVSTDGTDMLQFQDGQGMKKMFYNCDDHMYRVGDRQLPFGLQWVGRSEWVTLHRDFVHYLVTSDDSLVRGHTHFTSTLSWPWRVSSTLFYFTQGKFRRKEKNHCICIIQDFARHLRTTTYNTYTGTKISKTFLCLKI